MKLTSHKTRGARIELSMTPMIDVVFLLLIFFMTTSSFIRAQRDLDPAIRVQRRSASQATDLQPAIVEIVARGTGYAYRLGTREFTSPEELTAVLRQFENKLDGAFVRVPDDAPFAMAAAAIQACKAASFVPVSYVPAESVP